MATEWDPDEDDLPFGDDPQEVPFEEPLEEAEGAHDLPQAIRDDFNELAGCRV